MRHDGGPVIGVVGGCGGVGASTFAAVLALCAGPALLVDLNGVSGGIDVVLGVEDFPGARWSGLQLSGGRLESAALTDGLPRAGPCAVLAADQSELDPDAVTQVLDVGARSGPVVVDLPRWDCPERAAALLRADFVVVVLRGDVPGLIAAHAVLAALPELPLGVVVRRGALAAGEAAELAGAALLGELPSMGEPIRVTHPGPLPRPTARVARGVLDGLRVPAGAR